MSDLITERLKNALSQEAEKAKPLPSASEVPVTADGGTESEAKVVTTEEELEGYQIIKAILRNKVPVSRIVYRDGQTYFSVLLDDNNRKPICRLYLNATKKYIGLFDSEKKESKTEIKTLDDIFTYVTQLEAVLSSYEKTEK